MLAVWRRIYSSEGKRYFLSLYEKSFKLENYDDKTCQLEVSTIRSRLIRSFLVFFLCNSFRFSPVHCIEILRSSNFNMNLIIVVWCDRSETGGLFRNSERLV